MKPLLILSATLVLAGCGSSSPSDPPGKPAALVSLAPMKQGSAPVWLSAYGAATPALNGSQTISVQQPGQVTHLSVVAGVAVRAGQALGTFEIAPSAFSGFQQATTTLAAALKQRTTTAQLLSQKLATQDQMVLADKAVKDAEAAVAALKREGGDQRVRTLVAPFDGVVTNIAVAQGDRTQPGAALVTVARSGNIIATVGLEPKLRDQVHVGQQARIRRLGDATAIMGTVLRVDAVLNPTTHLIDVDIAFPNGAFLPNEAVHAEIAARQMSGWLVPHKAVVITGDTTRIFQAAGNKAHAVPVKLLLAGDTVDVVEGPVDPNRKLIVDGAYQVNEGDVVRTGGQA